MCRKQKCKGDGILVTTYKSAPPSKNAVSAHMKHGVDPSIKHPISGQSTTVVKICMYICLIMVFRYCL